MKFLISPQPSYLAHRLQFTSLAIRIAVKIRCNRRKFRTSDGLDSEHGLGNECSHTPRCVGCEEDFRRTGSSLTSPTGVVRN
jgi:hypothetical protein